MESVRLLPLSPGPFSLHVVLSEARGSPEPFARLSGEEDWSRVYLAVVKGDEASPIDFCAVKIQRNSYPVGLDGASPDTNPALDERWRAEAARIRDLAEAARFFPRLYRPDTGSDGADFLPPLLYCRAEKRFFTPPCPRCAAPLSLCRDDALLARAGLPLYSASLERFLHCASCAGEEGASAFYAYQVPAEAPEDLVSSASDLFRHLGEALAQKLLASFPCEECRDAAGRSEGVGKPFWEDRWTAFNFYESPYLVTGLGIGLDGFSDLLGGRPEEPLLEEKTVPRAASGVTRLSHPLLFEGESAGSRFLFDSGSGGLDAVEVLYLKLTAFRQIALGVGEYHRRVGRPHLDLHPRHILFDLSRAGEGLPLFWGFQARIHGLAGAARAERLAGAADVVVPPRNPEVPYAPPEVLEFHLNPPRPAQFVVSDLEDASGGSTGAKGWRFHGRLADPYGIYPTPRDHDWIFITLDNEALGLPGVLLPSRRDPRAKPDLQELAFISEPVALEEAAAQRLRKSAGARIPGARYKIYADFGAPSDLYSLGMIFLRMLLGNDGQDVRAIAEVVERVNRQLAPAGETTVASILTGAGAAALFERDPEILEVLKKGNIFYQELDRRPERPNAIPDALWKRAVLLGMRLVTRIVGFSFCADPADYDASHPTAKLDLVADEAGLLAAEVKSLLLHRQGVNLEIQQVLAELAEEKRLTASAAGAPR